MDISAEREVAYTHAVEALRRSPWVARANVLTPLLRPSIRLLTTRIPEHTLPIGSCKLGGHPDLPSGAVWPDGPEVPLCFNAQLDLSVTAPYDIQGLLPSTGMLYFWGDFWAGWRVEYHDVDPHSLERRAFPEHPTEYRGEGIFGAFAPAALTLGIEYTLPGWQHPVLTDLNLSDEDIEAYETLRSEILPRFPLGSSYGGPADEPGTHRLFGYGDGAGSAEEESARVLHEREEHKGAPMPSGSRWEEWLLLAQIDSDPATGMVWSDMGTLWFTIRRQDLAARRFAAGELCFEGG